MKKNKFSGDDDDHISKKFDEMEEILLELKKKEEMKGTNPSSIKGPEQMGIEKVLKEDDEELRLRMFSVDMQGTKSISNMKSPGLKNTRNYWWSFEVISATGLR